MGVETEGARKGAWESDVELLPKKKKRERGKVTLTVAKVIIDFSSPFFFDQPAKYYFLQAKKNKKSELDRNRTRNLRGLT